MLFKTLNGDIFMSVNQDKNFCCFGTDIGFYIYQIAPFKKILSRKIDGGVSIVKMLHESNIILFTGKNINGTYSNNKVIIWDDQEKKILNELSFNDRVVNIELTKNYIFVLCNEQIYIYKFSDLSFIKSVNVSPEHKLICIGREDSKYLAYPGIEKGHIHITKYEEEYNKTFKAHDNSIEQLYLSNDSNYIVTSSERGTIIRIFDLETRVLVNELRRGYDTTKIVNLSLTHDNSILLVSSIKGTIHLYNTGINSDFSINNKTWNKYGMKYVKSVLPEYFNSEWSFCQIYLKGITTYSIIDNTKTKIYTFGNNGQYYVLNYEDIDNPIIEETIKFLSDESDPFSENSTTIK